MMNVWNRCFPVEEPRARHDFGLSLSLDVSRAEVLNRHNLYFYRDVGYQEQTLTSPSTSLAGTMLPTPEDVDEVRVSTAPRSALDTSRRARFNEDEEREARVLVYGSAGSTRIKERADNDRSGRQLFDLQTYFASLERQWDATVAGVARLGPNDFARLMNVTPPSATAPSTASAPEPTVRDRVRALVGSYFLGQVQNALLVENGRFYLLSSFETLAGVSPTDVATSSSSSSSSSSFESSSASSSVAPRLPFFPVPFTTLTGSASVYVEKRRKAMLTDLAASPARPASSSTSSSTTPSSTSSSSRVSAGEVWAPYFPFILDGNAKDSEAAVHLSPPCPTPSPSSSSSLPSFATARHLASLAASLRLLAHSDIATAAQLHHPRVRTATLAAAAREAKANAQTKAKAQTKVKAKAQAKARNRKANKSKSKSNKAPSFDADVADADITPHAEDDEDTNDRDSDTNDIDAESSSSSASAYGSEASGFVVTTLYSLDDVRSFALLALQRYASACDILLRALAIAARTLRSNNGGDISKEDDCGIRGPSAQSRKSVAEVVVIARWWMWLSARHLMGVGDALCIAHAATSPVAATRGSQTASTTQYGDDGEKGDGDNGTRDFYLSWSCFEAGRSAYTLAAELLCRSSESDGRDSGAEGEAEGEVEGKGDGGKRDGGEGKSCARSCAERLEAFVALTRKGMPMVIASMEQCTAAAAATSQQQQQQQEQEQQQQQRGQQPPLHSLSGNSIASTDVLSRLQKLIQAINHRSDCSSSGSGSASVKGKRSILLWSSLARRLRTRLAPIRTVVSAMAPSRTHSSSAPTSTSSSSSSSTSSSSSMRASVSCVAADPDYSPATPVAASDAMVAEDEMDLQKRLLLLTRGILASERAEAADRVEEHLSIFLDGPGRVHSDEADETEMDEDDHSATARASATASASASANAASSDGLRKERGSRGLHALLAGALGRGWMVGAGGKVNGCDNSNDLNAPDADDADEDEIDLLDRDGWMRSSEGWILEALMLRKEPELFSLPRDMGLVTQAADDSNDKNEDEEEENGGNEDNGGRRNRATMEKERVCEQVIDEVLAKSLLLHNNKEKKRMRKGRESDHADDHNDGEDMPALEGEDDEEEKEEQEGNEDGCDGTDLPALDDEDDASDGDDDDDGDRTSHFRTEEEDIDMMKQAMLYNLD